MKEFEKKIMLSSAEYNLIRKLGFGFGATETQTNYYYDTDDFKYNEQNITLRIREKNGEYEATVKKHHDEPESYSTEETISCRDENDAELFRDYGVKLQGEMVTERCVSEPKPGVKIMLDHNRYLGGHDFEMEIEYDEGMEGEMYFYIESFAVCLMHYGLIQCVTDFNSRGMNPMSKSQRFFWHLLEERENSKSMKLDGETTI